MALPTPGASKNNWGAQLNEFLRVGHNEDGTFDADAIEDVIVNGLGMPTAAEAAEVATTTERLDSRVFDVRADGAQGTGAVDTTAIAATVALASARVTMDTRTTVALAPAGTHKVGRLVTGSSINGGIRLEPGVSLDGEGATLLLDNNSAFITNRWPIYPVDNQVGGLSATITADVGQGDTQYTVSSSTGFVADDWVFVRMTDNPWDDVEVKDTAFAKVVSIDSGTTMTLDRPALADCDVSDTTAGNKVIQKLYGFVDGGGISNLTLVNPMTGSANSEIAIDLRYVRNFEVANIAADQPGAGALAYAYCENILTRNLRVRRSDMQGGQTSKGRVLGAWNSKNLTYQNISAEYFEGVACFFESYCRGVVIDGMHLVNNHPDRVQASYPIFQIAQSCDVSVRNFTLEGLGGTSLVEGGGTEASNIVAFEGITTINTDTPMLGIPLGQINGPLRLYGVPYTSRVTWVYDLEIPNDDNVGTWRFLPEGLYRSITVYVSSTTGITNLSISNYTSGTLGDIKGQLVSGQPVKIPNAGFAGTNYPFNNFPNKAFYLATDATVPAGATLRMILDYWPES